jgi:hypothetical protein
MKKVLVVSVLMVLLMASTALAEVKVYDADGQYLGILMVYDGHSADIYIPSMGKFINSLMYKCDSAWMCRYDSLSCDFWDHFEILFQGADCAGEAYMRPYTNWDRMWPQVDYIFYRTDIDKCYLVMPGVYKKCYYYKAFGRDGETNFNCPQGTECRIVGGPSVEWLHPLLEIPKEELPFTLPISLPLRYEYEAAMPLPVVTVTAPNGGETWPIGSTKKITWTSSGITGYVSFQVSRNGGATWGSPLTLINDGSYDWKVTSPASTQARVRIKSVNNPSVFDTSNSNFIIQ